jgi:predicted alpha-1,6-mannanase (GH76 family)
VKYICAIFFIVAITCDCNAVLPGDDFNADTTTAISVLQQWYNGDGQWTTTGWWNAANCIDALENQITAQNGGSNLSVLANTYALNSSGNFLNDYYDDEGWWTEAWIKAYDQTGNPEYLSMAKIIFADVAKGWDSTCGGGVWWSKDKTYKNAIPNELFLLNAIRLHQRTPGDSGVNSYFYWATNEWHWFSNSGMINSQNLINDGLTANCENNGQTTWTYNQGVILGGLVDLYKSTGSSNYLTQAETLANAAISKLVTSGGVLNEPGSGGGDVPQFKGIFIRHLAELYDIDHKAAYLNFFYTNAHSVWTSDRNSANQLGFNWAGPVDTNDAARQSCAIIPLSVLAAPVTATLPFAKGAADISFAHNVGQAAGTLGWVCSPALTSLTGFMVYGPYIASLPGGIHTVHFRMSANAVSNSAANLVQLIVFNQGLDLAVSNVPWSAFSRTNQSQDFALAFTNNNAGTTLEFEVYWNAAANAPVVTVSDITVDGAHNWTAANLSHALGRLDGFNAWEADPVRDTASGYLATGPGAAELAPGPYSAAFELKVDNFNWDNSAVATISVVNADANTVVASQSITRSQFPDILYHPFRVSFQAVAGVHYDFRTYWNYATNAPRVTERSVVVSPSGSSSFVPVPLGSGAYNADIVIEHTAPAVPNGKYTTVSMDAGSGNTGNSWYEQGYDASAPGTGLPPAGSTIASQSASDHVYTLASSYAGNNVIMIDATHSGSIIPSLSGPFSILSFLAAAGHGPVIVDCDIHHADGSTETGALTIPDWFNNVPVAFDAQGRTDVAAGTFNSVNNNNPNLYPVDFSPGNTTSPVTRITLSWDTANSGSKLAAFFALSGVSPAIPLSGVQITPSALSVYAGQSAAFSVTATGTLPYTFQWLSNNVPIAGATNSTLALGNVAASGSAAYACVVNNNCGPVTGAPANLTVMPLPALLPQLSNNLLTLTWAGSNFLLLQSTNPAGPWRTNMATSPFQTNPASPALFFRLQGP